MGCWTDFVRCGGEFPEAVRAIDGCVLDGAAIFRWVGVSEIIGAVCIEWEVGGEKGRVEGGLGIIKECFSLGWGDCELLEEKYRWWHVIFTSVDVAECETDEAIWLIRYKGGWDLIGKFNNLTLYCSASYDYSIGTTNTTGSRSISVGNIPLATTDGLVGATLGRCIVVMPLSWACGQKGREDPAIDRLVKIDFMTVNSISIVWGDYISFQDVYKCKMFSDLQISTSRVKIQVQRLTANRDRNKILNTVSRTCRCSTILTFVDKGSFECFWHLLCGSKSPFIVGFKECSSSIPLEVGVMNSSNAECRFSNGFNTWNWSWSWSLKSWSKHQEVKLGGNDISWLGDNVIRAGCCKVKTLQTIGAHSKISITYETMIEWRDHGKQELKQ